MAKTNHQYAYARRQYGNGNVLAWILIGLILSPTIILLIICLWVADKHGRILRCSACGNLLPDQHVTLCAACRSSIVSKKQYDKIIDQQVAQNGIVLSE